MYQTDKELQEMAKDIIFAESEVTPELLTALAEKGIRNINVVPDEDYETAMIKKWFEKNRSENQ